MGLFLLFGDQAELDELANALGQGNAALLGLRCDLGESFHLEPDRGPRHLIAAGGMSLRAHQD